jgi:hypothetical protein
MLRAFTRRGVSKMTRARIRDDVRSAIAVQAARLMAEDGIEDYGLAKRKAARQLGLPETGSLPNNAEIESALREYQGIYLADDQRRRIDALREHALELMRAFAAFNPHLAGPVLSGVAGPYAAIQLQLYTDNDKAVELFLIDRGIAYRTSQARLFLGGEMRPVPVFCFDDDGVEVELVLLQTRDLRAPVRATPEGRIIERAKTAQVEALVTG